MNLSPLIDQLIEAFRCLPGVGPKSAQRMALHLLERNRQGGNKLSESLASALEAVGNCQQCRTLTEEDICRICSSYSRNVLMGHLSPIDGIGPEQLGINLLLNKVDNEKLEEVIIACNPTVEGDATAYYIAEQLKSHDVTVSRIAHGVPVGGELEFVDGGTLSHAFNGRKIMESN